MQQWQRLSEQVFLMSGCSRQPSAAVAIIDTNGKLAEQTRKKIILRKKKSLKYWFGSTRLSFGYVIQIIFFILCFSMQQISVYLKIFKPTQ